MREMWDGGDEGSLFRHALQGRSAFSFVLFEKSKGDLHPMKTTLRILSLLLSLLILVFCIASCNDTPAGGNNNDAGESGENGDSVNSGGWT